MVRKPRHDNGFFHPSSNQCPLETPVKVAAGRVVGASKIARDITDRKRAEARTYRPDGRIERRRAPNRSRRPTASCIVDDNADAASSLARLLQISRHQTHVAHDGLEAVEAAEAFRPDLVLLDIGLPKLNGYDVCRRIRAQPGGGNLLMVALTGWGQDDDRLKSKEAGFDHHMVKPVAYADLMKLFAELRPTGRQPA